MKTARTLIAPLAVAGALTIAPAASFAAQTPAPAPAPTTAAPGTTCPDASDFRLSAPSHTEVGGNIYDKQITFGAYWDGGNLPAGTQATLTAGPATVTLLNGKTYTAPVVAGGTITGVFPGGGAALAPSFRLPGSTGTSRYHVTDISYPVTVTGNFGTCTYTVKGTASSAYNVTSIQLVDA